MKINRWRLRFSLRTLLVTVLLIGSGTTLWMHWEPWSVERELPGAESVSLADDARYAALMPENSDCVQLWDMFAWKRLWSFPPEFNKHVAYFGNDSRMRLGSYGTETNRLMDYFRNDSKGRNSVYMKLKNDVTRFDLETGRVLRHFTLPFDPKGFPKKDPSELGFVIHNGIRRFEHNRLNGNYYDALRLYDENTNTQLAEFKGDDYEISRDENAIITWNELNDERSNEHGRWFVCLYDVEDGHLLHEISLESPIVDAGCLDSKTFYTFDDKVLSVWNWNSQKPKLVIAHPGKSISEVWESDDQTRLIVYSEHVVSIWSAKDGTLISKLDGVFWDFSSSPDGKRFLIRLDISLDHEPYLSRSLMVDAGNGDVLQRFYGEFYFLSNDMIVQEWPLKRWERRRPEYW